MLCRIGGGQWQDEKLLLQRQVCVVGLVGILRIDEIGIRVGINGWKSVHRHVRKPPDGGGPSSLMEVLQKPP